jgi:hypothetical protein
MFTIRSEGFGYLIVVLRVFSVSGDGLSGPIGGYINRIDVMVGIGASQRTEEFFGDFFLVECGAVGGIDRPLKLFVRFEFADCIFFSLEELLRWACIGKEEIEEVNFLLEFLAGEVSSRLARVICLRILVQACLALT